MCSTWDNVALPALGFPIRESTGQRLFSALPWLIAAVHALHRLLVPRHPPCALTILTVIWPFVDPYPLRDMGDHKRPGDTRFSRRLSMAADCGFCAVFKDRGEAYNAGRRSACADAISIAAAPTTSERRSLKTQQ